MKIVVTGCNGGVGTAVVKLALKRGHTVLGIDNVETDKKKHTWSSNPGFVFRKLDLQDFDATLDALNGYDAVITLAACRNPGDYKVTTHNINVVISWNILRACAELGINRVAQASSVNVLPMVFSQGCHFHYFPVDENHPCEPDEPYGISKLIGELQADGIIRRYPSMRIASLRLSWCLPRKEDAFGKIAESRAMDLWGYVQEDSVADAFLLAIADSDKWAGHERFFIVAPEISSAQEDTMPLVSRCFPDVPLKDGKTFSGKQSLFDCSKAAELLGWHHRDAVFD